MDQQWLNEFHSMTYGIDIDLDLSSLSKIDEMIDSKYKMTIIDKALENWKSTSGEILTREQVSDIAHFWACYTNEFYGLNMSEFRDGNTMEWNRQLTISDFAQILQAMWLWDSDNGISNGDSWYEIPHLKPAIFFGWSIQNNSMDVMRKNMLYLSRRYGFNFEYHADVGLFQGIGIGSLWLGYLCTGVMGSSKSETMTIRDISVACWIYNPSTKQDDCTHGQYWRDILNVSFGDCGNLWDKYGLDTSSISIRDHLDNLKLVSFIDSLP